MTLVKQPTLPRLESPPRNSKAIYRGVCSICKTTTTFAWQFTYHHMQWNDRSALSLRLELTRVLFDHCPSINFTPCPANDFDFGYWWQILSLGWHLGLVPSVYVYCADSLIFTGAGIYGPTVLFIPYFPQQCAFMCCITPSSFGVEMAAPAFQSFLFSFMHQTANGCIYLMTLKFVCIVYISILS